MKKSLQFVLPVVVSCFSFAGIAQALPDRTFEDISTWYQSNRRIQTEEGTARLSIFFNSQKNVEEETIDYRPKCYLSNDCFGNLEFWIFNTSGGQIEGERLARGDNLIKRVWGQEILDDFKTAKLVDTFANGNKDIKRWYQGKLYNYETWHYTNDTIVHFSVVSKKFEQAKRIQEYSRCARNETVGCGI
jgi:hypothetical protein